jgi:hypothetical protein
MNAAAIISFLPMIIAQQPTTGSAHTAGTCSLANSGTVNSITLNCTELSAQQQRLLSNIPQLLNKLLATQADNTTEILAKLNTCIAQGAPRSLTEDQRKRIIETLGSPPGNPEILIRATNSTAESSRYAQQLRSAFASTRGWKVPDVFENAILGATLPVGLVAYVQNDKSLYGSAIQRLFKELEIPIGFQIDPSLPTETVVLVVWQKPIE